MATRSKRWSYAETLFLINTLDELKIMKRVDGRKYKNNNLFKEVAEKFEEAGYDGRDGEQIKNKWKQLKQGYNKAKIDNGRSGASPSTFTFFDVMDRVLGQRPLAKASCYGVEAGFEDDDEDMREVNAGKQILTRSLNE